MAQMGDDIKERDTKIQRQQQTMADMASDQHENEQAIVELQGTIHTLEGENEDLAQEIGEMQTRMTQIDALTAERDQLGEQLVGPRHAMRY